MSSAILYLAIIAIWACVLIPRWLKRDSARGALQPAQFTSTAELATASDSPATTEVPDFVPDDLGLRGTTGFRDDTSLTDDAGRTDTAPVPGPVDEAEDAHTGIPAAAPVPVTSGESRRRIMKARRRLLLMILGLEAAGGALAGTGLAAWWVIAPPTVTLVGYLLLLREAAHADAEGDAREREALEAAEAHARERARQAREARGEQAAAPPAAAIPVSYAAAPVPEDYEDLGQGRDFTPGLRYGSARDASDHDAYDQYTENRLRAVGD